jgi:TetR/AcrR family transcriptional repressor of nem operon
MMGDLQQTHPGCLVVSFTYESQQFDDEIRESIRKGLLRWRGMMTERLESIMQKYPAKSDTNIDALADMFTSTIEGGIVLSRAFQDNKLLVDQILVFRNYVRMLFEP